MAGPSNGPADVSGFSRTRLAVGVVLVMVLAVAAVVGLARLVEGPHPGSLVYITEDGVVFRDLETGREEVVEEWCERCRDPVLNTETPALWYGRGGEIVGVDLATGERMAREVQGVPMTVDRAGGLVYEKPDRGLYRFWDDPDSEQRIGPADAGPREGPVLWSSRDRYVARFLDPEEAAGALLVVDLEGGEPTIAHRVRGAFPLTISPDGREVLYAAGSPGELTVLSLGDLESRELGFRGELTVAATSPAGVAAVGGRDAEGEPGVWALRGGEGEPERLADAAPSTLAWARDSSRLFYATEGGLYEVPVPEGRAKPLDVPVTHEGFLEVVR